MLSMPAYQSRAKLRDRLTIAIHNATGFGLQ
jgi:E3 ubiquitin-protein ligase HERC4